MPSYPNADRKGRAVLSSGKPLPDGRGTDRYGDSDTFGVTAIGRPWQTEDRGVALRLGVVGLGSSSPRLGVVGPVDVTSASWAG